MLTLNIVTDCVNTIFLFGPNEAIFSYTYRLCFCVGRFLFNVNGFRRMYVTYICCVRKFDACHCNRLFSTLNCSTSLFHLKLF